jgi:hypothetical protein
MHRCYWWVEGSKPFTMKKEVALSYETSASTCDVDTQKTDVTRGLHPPWKPDNIHVHCRTQDICVF